MDGLVQQHDVAPARHLLAGFGAARHGADDQPGARSRRQDDERSTGTLHVQLELRYP